MTRSPTHGRSAASSVVYKGDPLQDGVILWTRAVPDDDSGRDVDIAWEVSTDADFRSMTHSGRSRASAQHDYTFKVDVRGLMPGQRYYYRFRTARSTSPTGMIYTSCAADHLLCERLWSCVSIQQHSNR